MKFSNYVTLRESTAESLASVFSQVQKDIKNLFDSLRSKADKVISSGLGDDLKRSIEIDLKRIMYKLKAGGSTPAIATESAMYVKDIMETVDSVLAGNLDTAIQNIHKQVMAKIDQLKDIILNSTGEMAEFRKRMGGVRNRTSSMSNQLDTLKGRLDSLADPAQPLTGPEKEAAVDSMIQLSNFAKLSGGTVTLVAKNGTKIPVNPKSDKWWNVVKSAGDKRFKLYVNANNKRSNTDIDIGDLSGIYSVIANLEAKHGIENRAPLIKKTSGNKLRTRKLRDGEGGINPTTA